MLKDLLAYFRRAKGRKGGYTLCSGWGCFQGEMGGVQGVFDFFFFLNKVCYPPLPLPLFL